jgi:hypothetical protein
VYNYFSYLSLTFRDFKKINQMDEWRVHDSHRTNELSTVPGGSEVKVQYANGKVIVYDKIKHIKKYCSALMSKPEVIEIWVDEKSYWKR